MKIRGLEQGANDYMLKPFDEGELLARIKVHLKMKFLQDELKEKNERLRELSGTDELTRIDNRRRFMEHLRTEFSRARRHKLPMALVLFDIDFFKNVNDGFGHLVGDSVLVQVVEIMRSNLRQSDVLGRWGGEEISLLLPHTNLAGGIKSADRMREAIANAEFAPRHKQMKITVSGGVTSHPEREANDIDDLLKQADDALYQAKSIGRNLIESA
jgi:diguanylate cyclase (GGDEF)-like protein